LAVELEPQEPASVAERDHARGAAAGGPTATDGCGIMGAMKRARVTLICKGCEAPFDVVPCRAEHEKTCGKKECSAAWRRKKMLGNQRAAGSGGNATSFRAGDAPWNKGMAGLHLSPASEFQPGHRPVGWCPIGTVKIRRFKRNDERRAFVKVAEPSVWRLRAHVEWEKANGRPVPHGYLVHHEDRDKLNDTPSNLVLMTRSAHLIEHHQEYEPARRAGLRRAARPSAAGPSPRTAG
jgi:hypothetical protein